MGISRLMNQAAAGVSGGPVAIEDVFSTYLYTGNGSTQTITNGIDLAGEGGLVWLKRRSAGETHYLYDTERGVRKSISSDSTAAQQTLSLGLDTFNSDGFRLNVSHTDSGVDFSTWTFRQAPRFFDVVTTSIPDPEPSTFTVNHNLGTTVGMVVVKTTTSTYDWIVFHRSLPSNYQLDLNNSDAQAYYGGTNWSSTNTTVTLPGWAGQSGGDVVIYLFAHDPLGPSGDGSDGLIACGSFTVSAGSEFEVDLGWEPSFVLAKRTDSTGNWDIFDTMRGFPVSTNGAKRLIANGSNLESTLGSVGVTSTGFKTYDALTYPPNATYIYIAIRRGPMRAPTSGTDVYAAGLNSSGSYTVSTGWPADFAIQRSRTADVLFSRPYARLTGTNYLETTATTAESSGGSAGWANNTGYSNSTVTSTVDWVFRRAPGFLDVVAAPWADGSSNPHNLGVTPELIIKKTRTTNNSWFVWTTGFANNDYLNLNTTASKQNNLGNLWVSIDDTQFTTANYSITTPSIFYLFATLPGVSKVGSYTGDGTNGQIIDCGFSAGARFVLVKRTDSTGPWYVYDSTRGIVSGNDPRIQLQDTAAEATSVDEIDPHPSGFIANNDPINYSGATYVFLAIA